MARVLFDGVVQGVGFRPFIYRAAVDHGLAGYVRNLGAKGVEVVVEGSGDEIRSFINTVEEGPPLSEVRELKVEWGSPRGFEGFSISGSSEDGSGSGVVPPDTAICSDCLMDIHGEGRFSGYWATSCVNCGPRFCVLRKMPYDRENTSMSSFELCSDCKDDYNDPGDRRYHAQTIACAECGPSHYRVPGCSEEPIKSVAEDILDGDIVAVKGAGGTHLVCLAREKEVRVLRDRLDRESQPFAVMAPDIESVGRFARLSDVEREVLSSNRRPIVLLEKKRPFKLAGNLSPQLHTIGVMLPYSGTHQLLFNWVDRPVVMTSGNMPGRPMHIKNDEILSMLGDVADSFLLHDREIVNRCDDSVLRMHGDKKRFIRRSRGFVPESIELPVSSSSVLGLGPMLDNTVAVGFEGDCVVSQYIGDLDNPDVFSYYRDSIERLLDITGLGFPETIVRDLHPQYKSSVYAEEIGDPVKVQHHHAHIASVMGEHSLRRVIGIAVDGAGYGEDGSVWGGEVLYSELDGYEKVGGLSSSLMPGGDLAAVYPSRMVAGILYPDDGLRGVLEGLWFKGGEKEIDILLRQLEQDVNVFRTSSAGRFLDAVSALLGVCYKRGYEGEPAMKLEALASRGDALDIDIPFKESEGGLFVDSRRLLRRIIGLKDRAPNRDVAATAQTALARGLTEIALMKAREYGVDAIAVSGGVSYNEMFMKEVGRLVDESPFDFFVNEKLPPGDGGVSYGQVVVGSSLSGDGD